MRISHVALIRGLTAAAKRLSVKFIEESGEGSASGTRSLDVSAQRL